jgi:hypothetical protein
MAGGFGHAMGPAHQLVGLWVISFFMKSSSSQDNDVVKSLAVFDA